MTAYYNEIDPYAAQWLRNLIAAGHIAPGEVDERSIEDVRPVDLLGYTQCHFFAGIGVWSHALRRAGWPDDRPVWTGSCPCQPFSAAGKGGGTADERHLWPAWFHLISHAKPRGVPVFGEQVASKPGLAWLDLVHADLEGSGHTVRATDLCAAGVGAPHIRQRLYFVADTVERAEQRGVAQSSKRPVAICDGEVFAGQQLADAERGSAERRGHNFHAAPRGTEEEARERQRIRVELGASGNARQLADANGGNASAERQQRSGEHGQQSQDSRALSGWPTPTRDEAGGSIEQFLERKRKLGGKCGVSLTALNLTAQLASWPTTRSSDGEKNVRTAGGSLKEIERKGSPQDLNQAASLASWPTPLSNSGTGAGTAGRDGGGNLQTVASWATPTTRDHKDGACLDQITGGAVPVNALLGRQVLLATGGLAYSECERGRRRESGSEDASDAWQSSEAGATNGFWRDTEWLPCIDGKARPVEPGTFPLANGITARVGRLRAYGNAIVAPCAEAFIRAYLEDAALSELL